MIAKQVFDLWYNEVELYDFNNPVFSTQTGHFTQVVWVNSKILGCGVSCNNGNCYSCCVYDPAGNIRDQLAENVLPIGVATTTMTMRPPQNTVPTLRPPQ